jgi:paired amphipathic helix protein Sin3a
LEFCKLCNLYTQDIVTASFILHRAHPFIGTDPSLTNWLRDFLGVEGDDDENEVTPRAGASRVSLSRARGLGPSYRLLPKAVCV